jgi:DNA-3-methyladenine glycosylase II
MTDNKMLQLTENDAVLKNIIKTIPEPQFQSSNNVFHDLMSCILEQQIHYRSTKKIFQKMLNTASLEILTPENFPQFEEKAFSNIKLSTGKYETVLRIIEFWNENKISWQELNDEEIISTLSSIKGIGKWTIDMILLYTLQRPNVFPYDDFHLKEIMVKLYGLDPNVKLKAQMIDVSNTWGEHKSLAVRYLLAYKDFNKKRKSE